MEAIKTFYRGFGRQIRLFQWLLEQPLKLGFQFGRVGEFALPDDYYFPAGCLKSLGILVVPLDVAGEFRFPKRDVAFGRIALLATVVPMPEAPMNENGGGVASENDVGLAGECLSVQPEAEARPMQH